MSIGARYQATLAQTTGLRDLESARERGNATILDQEGVAWVRICRSILALRSEAEQQQLVDRDLAARAAVLREWLASFLGPDGMLERFCASWRTAFAFEAVQWVMTQHAAAVQAVAVIAQCEAQVAARIAVARLEGADRQIMERGETKELTAIAAAFEHHRQLQSIKESEQRLRETVILAERGHWASLARSIVQFEMRSKLEDEVMRERCLTRREFCIGVVALAEAHHGVCVAHAELTMRSRLCAEFLLDLASATRRAMGTAQEAGQRWIAQQCVTHADEWKGRSAIVTEEKVSRRNTVAVICGIVEAQSRVVLETLYHARCKAFELENAAEVALLDVARMELQSRNHLYMLANRGCCVALEFDEKRGRERLASAWRRQLDGTARLYVTSERMVEYARCDECERGARRRVAALATADLDALRVQQLTTAETEERGRIVAVEVAARTFEARVNAMTECAHDQKRRLAIRGASEIAVVAAACTALAACCAEEETRRRRLIDDARRDAAAASILVQHRFAFDAIARDEGHERERLRSIVPPFSVLSTHAREQARQRNQLAVVSEVALRLSVAELYENFVLELQSCESAIRQHVQDQAFHRVAEQGTAALRDLRLALASAREERDSTCHRGDRPEVNCQEMSPAPMSGDASRSPFPIVPTTHSSLLAFYTGGRDAHTVCPDPVSPQHEESHPAAAGPSDPIPMLLYRAIHDGSKAGARPLDASKRPATEVERGPTNVNDYGAVMSQNRATRNRQSGATEKSVSCVSFLFDYIGAMVANLRRKFSSAAI